MRVLYFVARVLYELLQWAYQLKVKFVVVGGLLSSLSQWGRSACEGRRGAMVTQVHCATEIRLKQKHFLTAVKMVWV